MEYDSEYDPEEPLFSHELKAYEKCLKAEPDFMAAEGYVNSSKSWLRRKAVQMIAQHSKSERFDAFIPYLAMNYFDRFVSRHEIPIVLDHLREDFEIFALCCLTLAWKMRKKSFSVSKFLTDQTLNIDRKLVMRMELLILGGLEWRMRSLTALCFVEYFVPYFKLRDPLISQGFKRRNINEIIIQAQGDITFTKFRPSIIAASALLVASFVLYPRRFPGFVDRISSVPIVREEVLLECLDAMDKLCKEKKIVVERPRTESAAASSSHRDGKAPMGEIEEVPEEATLMNFELDWVYPDAEYDDEPISFPLYRHVPTQMTSGRNMCCFL